MKKAHLVGSGALVVVLAFAMPVLRGPTEHFERSMICNFKKDALAEPNARSGWGNSDCYIKEQVDNWYYIVGEYGWSLGSTNHSEAIDAPTLLVKIRSGETSMSREYANFCEGIFISTLNNNRAELVGIMEIDTAGGFSLSCPAEESSNAA
ncbi:hypothetical protein [Ruegeria faecimaris]|uniref:Uncharacterized protein n=1 Tax=Ruegeria faecimaris TaxID=686389 RepID=A0A521BSV9_9RHOB|nr:hypothetical protein [Ruegeria faecimaris]SMO50244.1 hypothetical protein SAMN06265380_1011165 [Ruegeria faecimaris]